VRADLEPADAWDEQQLYGGTQSALSTTLLLWRRGVRSDWRTTPDAHPEAEVTEGEGEPAYSEGA
jgi:hypothetical protein